MINVEVLKQQMSQLGQSQYCEFCVNGEEALNTAIEMIQIAATDYKMKTPDPSGECVRLQPIKIMLLDF